MILSDSAEYGAQGVGQRLERQYECQEAGQHHSTFLPILWNPKKLQKLPVQVEKAETCSYQLQYPICQRLAPLSTNSPSLLDCDPSIPFSVPCFGVNGARGERDAAGHTDMGQGPVRSIS